MLWDMFKTFLKIGAFTFGGGFAMIPIIQAEIVDKRKWISSEEFMDAIAIAQASPGSMAVNSSIYVGYKLKGLKGAIACLLGTVLPSFIIILIIATFFYRFRDNRILDKVFLGIRPAIVALIASAVYQLIKNAGLGYDKLLVALATTLIIVFLGVSPIWLILVGAVGSVVINKIRKNNRIDDF